MLFSMALSLTHMEHLSTLAVATLFSLLKMVLLLFPIVQNAYW